jgi:hypothetical protein
MSWSDGVRQRDADMGYDPWVAASNTETAVICQPHQDSAVRECWPGCRIFHPGQAKVGHRFERLIVLWAPRVPHEGEWLEDFRTGLKPGGKVIYLV